MIGRAMDVLMTPAAKLLDRNHMGFLGVNATSGLAKTYNRLRFQKFHEFRVRQYRENFRELIEENGNPVAPINVMKDGWVIDTSGNLPYLEELISEAGEIIKKRGVWDARSGSDLSSRIL